MEEYILMLYDESGRFIEPTRNIGYNRSDAKPFRNSVKSEAIPRIGETGSVSIEDYRPLARNEPKGDDVLIYEIIDVHHGIWRRNASSESSFKGKTPLVFAKVIQRAPLFGMKNRDNFLAARTRKKIRGEQTVGETE